MYSSTDVRIYYETTSNEELTILFNIFLLTRQKKFVYKFVNVIYPTCFAFLTNYPYSMFATYEINDGYFFAARYFSPLPTQILPSGRSMKRQSVFKIFPFRLIRSSRIPFGIKSHKIVSLRWNVRM